MHTNHAGIGADDGFRVTYWRLAGGEQLAKK